MLRRDQCSESSSSTPQLPPRPSERNNDVTDDFVTNNRTHRQRRAVCHDLRCESIFKSRIHRSGMMGAIQKVNPFKSTLQASSTVKAAASQEPPQVDATAGATQSSGKLMGVIQKVNPFKSTPQVRLPEQASAKVTRASSSGSLDQGGCPDSPQNPGRLQSAVQKMNPFRSASQASSAVPKAPSSESLEPGGSSEPSQNPGVFVGMMQKVNPFKSTSSNDNLSSSTGSLTDNNNATKKQTSEVSIDTVDQQPPKENPGMFQGMMQKVNPFKATAAEGEPAAFVGRQGPSLRSDSSSSSDSGSLDDGSIERHSVWYAEESESVAVRSAPKEGPPRKTLTFRIKRILPAALFSSGTKTSSAGLDDGPLLAQAEEVTEVVEVQTLQLADAPEPGDDESLGPLDDEEGLMSWWRTVEGWDEWNQSTEDAPAEEEMVEEAADRVFMAARLFVRLFNRRGGTLQTHILELLALADDADSFHKRTVKASVGGGVASVAGSITTITGLILAPFTMGTSLIVTAVGIGVATAGGLVSASANITDTVHSKTDRKKVEKMIQDYQDSMRDISDCLQFVQDGMEALEAWDFETYAEVITRSHLNQNVKHVVKEGGRAGKALLINTESLVSTIQVLSVSGVAAKAAQVMSVTTGVMSGLFLALDVFFLAKDSMELKKGAKTEFAVKIREVCQELQGGLLELNRIKEQLQKTMDGIEVEAEGEGGDDEGQEEELRSSVKKLIELEE
ncbi:uncharacterized protein LOC130370074 isoform X2 [Gadus chalcogrammus]|uniref:uncharacterized protein LOC130370074 isoform X2 n=1 Tax=Gadus chalcogrammus TaxID=1042646 RepID=UPI0024C4D678|nr:uncharacterized protein LOC130370074 isoform X2 [Gadus chalcogrammus]